MILEKVNNLDIQRIGDDIEGVSAGIDIENFGIVMDIVSNQLYSNPIGSLIREITSNCFDSHIEAGVDDPVVINKSYSSEEGYSIEFKDVGVGISPERMLKIYSNYFSSSKRDNNGQLGGFGLGSKTPLAYTDMFYITTVYDGIKYEYIYHKDDPKPVLDSIHGWEYIVGVEVVYNEELDLEEEVEVSTKIPIGIRTSERNGTVIKVNIEDNQEVYSYEKDIHKFEAELQNQLTYFDNVYFTRWNISNDYDIYEGDHFKFRSDIRQTNNEIHLCIGKVRYPINFKKVPVPDAFQKIPIAVKFEIGDLPVTPSREEIRYKKEVVDKILEKIKLAVQEITELFEAQNPEVESLKEYILLQNVKPAITFNKEKGHKLAIWTSSNLIKSYRFKPISHLPLKKAPKSLFFMWEEVGEIDRLGKRTASRYSDGNISNDFILTNKYVIVDKDSRYSSYTDLHIVHELYGSVTLIKRKALDYEIATEILGITNSKDVRKARVIKEYVEVMDGLVKNNARSTYSKCRPTEEWIAEYKKSLKESSLAYKRKLEKKVFVRDANHGFRGRDMRVEELKVRTGILVYGFKEDQSILSNIYTIVTNNKLSIRKIEGTKKLMTHERMDKAFLVLQVSYSVEKEIKGAKKTVHWEQFIKTKFFRKVITAMHMKQEFESIASLHKLDLRKKLLRGFEKAFREAKNSIIDAGNDRKSIGYYSLPSKLREVEHITSLYEKIYYFRDNYRFDVPLLKVMDSNPYDDDLLDYVDYLKYKGVKLENKWYLKSKKQVEYEHNLWNIFATFRGTKTNNHLLTYTLNQEQNVNEERSTSSTEEDYSQYF